MPFLKSSKKYHSVVKNLKSFKCDIQSPGDLTFAMCTFLAAATLSLAFVVKYVANKAKMLIVK